MKHSIASISLLKLMVLSCSLASCPLHAEVAYITEDHLVPKNPAIDGAIRPILARKLFVTPADCALVLIRPPEGGEAAVAVYRSRSGNSPDSFSVTVTKAEKNIDMTANVESLDAANKIRVARCDAVIPKTSALAIHAAWDVMLDRAQELRVYARPTLHREELEFSIARDGQTEVFAALPNRGGKSVSALVRLAKQIERYCHAPPAARTKLANKLERDAKRLVEEQNPNGAHSQRQ